jgi:hypothetical protein
MRLRQYCILAGALFVCAPLGAHHNAFACLARDTTVTIEGVVKEFRFENPHAILTITAANGSVVTAEWLTIFELSNGWGITREFLGQGDRVVVRGSPYLCETNRISLLSEVRRLDDGWSWTSSTD